MLPAVLGETLFAQRPREARDRGEGRLDVVRDRRDELLAQLLHALERAGHVVEFARDLPQGIVPAVPEDRYILAIHGLSDKPVENAELVVGHLVARAIGIRDPEARPPDPVDIVVDEDHLLGSQIGHRVNPLRVGGMVFVHGELHG